MPATPDFVHPITALREAILREDALAAYDCVDASIALIRVQKASMITLPAPIKRIVH